MTQLATPLQIDTLMVLLLVASAVGMAVKWVKLPYSIALVIVGLIIGILNILPPVQMTPELILLIFLPALLFEASWNLDLRSLTKNWLPIGILATLGVVIGMLTTAGILHSWAGINPSAALLFGALIAATDPISVLALFRNMGIDTRLTLLLEGESLFNDGTAVVLFQLVLAIAQTGGHFSLPVTVGSFLLVVLGGVLVGLVMGFGASRLTRWFDDHLIEITLTTIIAYGSFLVAKHIGVSPVIAVVTAGIVLGNYGSRASMSPATRLAVNDFWEYAAFVVNSLVFLLIGMQVKIDLLIKYGPLIGIGIVAILAARLVVVYGLCPFVSSRDRPIPWSWRHLLFWGALRGSLCMALALSLPLDFPMRQEIIILTFGVVLFTLLAQGLTVEPLVRLLGLLKADPRLKRYELLRGQLMAEGEAMTTLESLLQSNSISWRVFEQLQLEIRKRQDELSRLLDELHLVDASLKTFEVRQTRKQLLEVRKDFLVRLAREDVLSSDVLQELLVSLDQQIDELRQDAVSLSPGQNAASDAEPLAGDADEP